MDIPVIIEESVLCYLVLKVVGKKHCQFVFFMKLQKTYTYQIQRCVEKDTHACKNPNMCMVFHKGGATFCICDCTWAFDIWYDIISISIISDAYLQYQTSKTSWKHPWKNCLRIPTHVREEPHTKKTGITTSKQINFTCVHPLNLRILKKLLFQVFIEPFQK